MVAGDRFHLKMALMVPLALASFSVLHRNVFHYIHYFTIYRFIVTFFLGNSVVYFTLPKVMCLFGA